ncbi:Sulfotransferase domain protein [Microbulbifer aggregans]|uniref:Sulfotransferase domain protein n=1 Tax=Microbulbifer aggregans TaxID=1769779 RepID=A0A1C9W7S7_9GAMM|nr:sulfotransferase [Microbulbifer aggregans]AOS97202.1 Sulfotransferase domain protein [Microbulbifer aggregans]
MIFVVGNSRSGTTMMSRILGRGSRVCNLQEVHFFEWMVSADRIREEISYDDAVRLFCCLIAKQEQNFYRISDPDQYVNRSRAVLDPIPRRDLTPISVYKLFLGWWAEKVGVDICCEQTPKNVFYIEEILEHFPDSKIINMVRDPRAVAFSQRNKWKRRFYGEDGETVFETIRAWSLYHPILTGRMWSMAVDAGFREDSERVKTIRFEDLVADPHRIVREVCDFCEIEFDPVMLNVPVVGSSLGKDEPSSRGISSSNIASWESDGGLSSSEIFWIQKVAGRNLARAGYELSKKGRCSFRVGSDLLTFPFKCLFALVLNTGRMANLLSTIRRRFGGARA